MVCHCAKIVLPLVLLLLGEPLLLDAVLLPGLEPDVSPELLLCVFVPPSTACNGINIKFYGTQIEKKKGTGWIRKYDFLQISVT